MARARNIKPGFFKNYDLADLGPFSQLLFSGLWCLADKEGRLEDKPRLIKAEIFPYYDVDVNGELTKLERLGFVVRYQVNGVALIEVMNFKEHQSPHHTEKPSALPARSDHSASKQATEPLKCLTVNPQKSNGGNPPDSLIHRFTDSLIPDSLIPDSPIADQHQKQPLPPANAAAEKIPADPKEPPNPLNLETWQAYKVAYASRYTVEPVRDAAVNAKIKSIVRGLGAEAPAVAAFFVSHNGSRYVAAMHQIGLLSADYAKLRTEWATNTRMTQTKALQADKTATNLDAFAPLIAAAREREQAERAENAK